MRKPWPVVLLVLILVTWGVNGAVISFKGSNSELYPMTGFRMFSGGAGNTANTYYLSMPTGEDLPASQAFDPERELTPSVSSQMMSNLKRSYENGCEQYQGVPFEGCPGEPSEYWTMPADLASLWAEVATARLGLQEDPEYMEFVLVEARAEDGVHLERTVIYRFDPDTGNTWAPED